MPGEKVTRRVQKCQAIDLWSGILVSPISKYVAAGHSVARLSPRPNFVLMPCFGMPTNLKTTMTITTFMSVLLLSHVAALAWNIPGHMLSGAMAYQILQRESP